MIPTFTIGISEAFAREEEFDFGPSAAFRTGSHYEIEHRLLPDAGEEDA